MRTLTCDLLLTIDGYAAADGAGPFFGYAGPDLDAWVHANLRQPQEVLMGRVTYEAMARVSHGGGDPISARMNELPKLVFSNTLREPLAWQPTRRLSGELRPAIEQLKREAGDPIRTIGSLALVKSLLALRLVDRLRLIVFPIAAGAAGRDPAFAGFPASAFELEESAVLDGRLVSLVYRPPVAGADDAHASVEEPARAAR